MTKLPSSKVRSRDSTQWQKEAAKRLGKEEARSVIEQDKEARKGAVKFCWECKKDEALWNRVKSS